MTKESAHIEKGNAIHHKPTGEGMTKIVNPEVFNTRLFTSGFKRILQVLDPFTHFNISPFNLMEEHIGRVRANLVTPFLPS